MFVLLNIDLLFVYISSFPGDTYIDSRGTDTNPSLGQTLTLMFRVASLVNISVQLIFNGTQTLSSPSLVRHQVYETNISALSRSDAGSYNFSVFNIQTMILLDDEIVTISTTSKY